MDIDTKKLEDMDNNTILFTIKQLESDYEAIKLNMIKDYDKLLEIEKQFNLANKIILKRLKGDN